MKQTIRRIFVLYGISVLSLCCLPVHSQEVIAINIAAVNGPATQRASGFLHGFSGTVLPDSLLFPLKIQYLRSSETVITRTYSRCKAMGTKMQIVVSDGWPKTAPKPGDNGNWEPWETYLTDLANRMKTNKMTDVRYGIWNDSHYWVPSTQFFEAYKRAYKVLRQIQPDAVIVGPTSMYRDRNTYQFVHDFLSYCITNNCFPDIVSYHDYSDNGLHIVEDAKRIRAFVKAHGGPDSCVIELADQGSKITTFKPGAFVSHFAGAERAGIINMCKCCWNNDCNDNSLEGCLTETRKKRSLWWCYKAYADVTGMLVAVSPGVSVDAVAGIDSLQVIRCLAGRFTTATGNITIRFNNVPAQITEYHVAGQRIPDTDSLPLSKPLPKIDEYMTVSGNQLLLPIADLAAYDAYYLKLTPSKGMSVKPIVKGSLTASRNELVALYDLNGRRIGPDRLIRVSMLSSLISRSGCYIISGKTSGSFLVQ